MAIIVFLTVLGLLHRTIAHSSNGQNPIAGPHEGIWFHPLPGDGGTQVVKSRLGGQADVC